MAGIGGTDARSAEKLGYLGIGMMGFPMTRRLVSAGYDVTVWNRSSDKAAALVEAGARLAPQPRAIAARRKAANGMGWIDAPVSGGTMGAEEGTLAVMTGGDAADIERVRPYVMAMARRLTHMGPTGAGQTTKLCNQVIVGCAMAVLAEATRLAVNAGIDAKRLPEALAGGFADSIPLQLFVPRMVQGIHSPPLGHIATMLKDLDTVIDVARETSSPVPMAALAAQLFRLAKSARGADADALEIYKLSASQVS